MSLEYIRDVLSTWGTLLGGTFATWWGQLTSIDGAIAAVVLLLMFIHRPLASRVEGLMVKGQTIPSTVAISLVGLWFVVLLMGTVHGRIQPPPPPLAPASPVLAENPDHAGIREKLDEALNKNQKLTSALDDANKQLDELRSELTSERNRRDAESKRRAVRLKLGEFMTEGQQLRTAYIRSHASGEAEALVTKWHRESLQYIEKQLGADYAARYQRVTSSGMGIQGFPVAKMGVVDAIESKLKHLETFLSEMR